MTATPPVDDDDAVLRPVEGEPVEEPGLVDPEPEGGEAALAELQRIREVLRERRWRRLDPRAGRR